MNSTKKTLEELDQYDYLDGEYIEKVWDKYSPLIGSFLISFSCLEHELNLVLADFVNERGHEPGFIIFEKITLSNKIDLFYKLFIRKSTYEGDNYKIILDGIRKDLDLINTFRNSVVHANWQSLSKDGFVRTKIVVDSQEGFVKFYKVQITPKIIKENIKKVDKLVEKIEKYQI